MANDIVNRVAQSKLEVIDLEDFYPEGKRVLFDIKDWLFQGLVLREKEFRQFVKTHDWKQYQDQYVALTCSSDAIIPAWAFMLITIELTGIAKKTITGDLISLETSIYQDIIKGIDTNPYKGKPIIIKGCSNKPVPDNAYNMLSEHLKPVASSIMYGEACSAVPLFKAKK